MDVLDQMIDTWRQPLAVTILFMMLLWESLSPYFIFFRGKVRERLAHDGRNLFIGILNAFIVSLLFVWLWKNVADWTFKEEFGILYMIPMPSALQFILAALILDFWTYWWHRMNHVIPFLWRFHKVHHSDPKMDVTTANRFHPGEIVFSSLLRIPLLLITGVSLGQLALYEMILLISIQFHHANIGLPESTDRLLRIIFVSPAMHKVHHSRIMPETNSNYTSLLSVWDRLFGSFLVLPDPHKISFGLNDTDLPEQQTLWGLSIMPVKSRKNRRPTGTRPPQDQG